jgi:hypothetical protein
LRAGERPCEIIMSDDLTTCAELQPLLRDAARG